MQDIKTFFGSKGVKITSATVWAVSTISLLIGGVSQETISQFIVIASTAVSGVTGIVAFISAMMGGKK